jgi:hypothetical protein
VIKQALVIVSLDSQYGNAQESFAYVNAANMPWNSAKTKPGMPTDFKFANAFGSVSPEKTAFTPLPMNWLLGLSENTREYPNKNHYVYHTVNIHILLYPEPTKICLIPGQ